MILPYIVSFIAFFAVVPFDNAVVTLYKSETVSSVIMRVLQFFVLGYAFYILLKKKPFTKSETKILIRYTVYFVFIAFLNAWATVFSSKDLSFDTVKTIAIRTMSMVCIWGFLVCCAYLTKDRRIYYGLSSVMLFLMLLSVAVYVISPSHAQYLESAGNYSFKGIAMNRNTYMVYAISFILGAAVILYDRMEFDKKSFKEILKSKKNIILLVLTALFVLFALATVFITKSTTGRLLTLGIIALIVLFSVWKKPFPMWVVPAVYAAVWLVIGVIGIDKIIPAGIFEKIFHKSVTLSFRTVLWEAAKNLSLYSVFTGFGFDNTYLADMHLVASAGTFINDPHNSVLYMLITQGILGFAAFLYMICTPLIKAGRVRNNRIITYLMIFIAIILLRGLVESVFQYSDMILWAMVVAVEFEAEKENRKDVTVEDV